MQKRTIRMGWISLSPLRNIFFVKERIVAKQSKSLQRDYISALKHTIDQNPLKALLTWKKIVNVYNPNIEEHAHFAYNMAINQVTTNDDYLLLQVNGVSNVQSHGLL